MRLYLALACALSLVGLTRAAAPVTVLVDPTTFVLIRPTAAEFSSSNNLGGAGSTYIFTANDFNESGSTISTDYTNGQKATGSLPGFLSAADWTTFNAKAPTASPTFTGTPVAPTAAVDTNTTQLATTAFVIGQAYLKSSTAASTYQGLDSDLTSIAALATTSFGRGLLIEDSSRSLRTTLSLVPGTNFLPYPSGTPTGSKFLRDDNTWVAIAGGGDALVANPLSQFAATTSAQLASVLSDESGASGGFVRSGYLGTAAVEAATAFQPADADLTTYANITPSANVQSLLGAADYSAMRTQLSLVPGTNVQAYDADLTTYAGITPSANIQTFLGAANYAAMRTQLGLVISTDVQAYDSDLTTWGAVTPGSGVTTFLATPSSTNLAAAVTGETGTGALVFAESPTLVTPALGTPSSVTLTNATGLPIATGVANLGAGVSTFLITPTSANLATILSDETGTGAAVLATSPTLVTPTLGVATATSIATTRQAHGNAGATETFDRANGDAHTATLDANLTVTLSGWSDPGTLSSMLLGLTQDGTGGRTVTWPAAVVTAPTVSTTASAITWVNLWTTDGGTTIYASSTADTGGALIAANNLSDVANASTSRTNLGLAIGTNVQAYDADLTSLAAAAGTNTIYYRSAADTWSAVSIGGNMTFSGGVLNSSGGASAPTVNAQTGTTYTLVLGDANNIVTMSNASANTLTIPPNSSVAFATGTIIQVQQGGAGDTTFDPGVGVTMNGATSNVTLSDQYEWATLVKLGTDAWALSYMAGPGTGDMLAANNLSDLASASTARTNLGVAIGTNVQAYDADLTTWAGVTPGTGVATALAVNVGSAGAPVINGGALGTPSSGDTASVTLNVGNADTTITRTGAGQIAVEGVKVPLVDVWIIPLGDETTAITTGLKFTFRAPYAATVTDVRASLTTASSSGAPILDIHDSGTTIMTTNKLLIDQSEKTTTTASTLPTLTDTSIADDAEITIEVDTAGTGAAGAKVAIYVTRT